MPLVSGFLTETQQSIQELARQFVADDVWPVSTLLEKGEAAGDDYATLRHLWQRMGELGFTGLPFPEQYGGSATDSLSYFLVLTEIAKASAALATALSVHVSLIGLPLLEFGTPEQQAKYLPNLITAQTIGAFALTEANAGSDAASGLCKAEKDGDDYVLNGTKLFISNAMLADVFLVTARTNPGDTTHRGLSAFIIERGMAGFSIVPGEEKMGLKGGDWGELVFDNCRIPASQRFGPEGHGFKVFMNSLNVGRIGIASVSLGVAQACLDASLKYSAERQQFGQSINQFQAIQFKLADMATEIEAAKQLVISAARLKEGKQPFAQEASMAKLYASELANRCANTAVQIHGGYGYTTDFPVERFFRDARVMSLFEGTSEIQRTIIARGLTTAR
ncbi:MAG: acyl-CoA dehydrogenase family protein [Vampirovibrionales bacterium]